MVYSMRNGLWAMAVFFLVIAVIESAVLILPTAVISPLFSHFGVRLYLWAFGLMPVSAFVCAHDEQQLQKEEIMHLFNIRSAHIYLAL